MDTLYRRWLILKMIPRHGGSITTAQIAERIDPEIVARTVRSIQRDMVELERHFPITFAQEGRAFHWSWNEGWQLSLPVMDPHTALTFHLVREYVASLLPITSVRFLEPFFKNAEDILAENNELRLAHWPDKVRVVQRKVEIQPSIMKGVTETVYDAVLMGKRIKACYRKKDDEAAQVFSELHPLGLVFVEGLIYLVATEGSTCKPHQFLLHRIEEVKLLEKPAKIPEGFTLQGYIESGEFSYPVMKVENIRLKAIFDRKAAAYLHEMPTSENVRLKDFDDKRILLEAEVLVNRKFRCWLRGFGAEVEVLAPEGLREEFRSTVDRLKLIYQ